MRRPVSKPFRTRQALYLHLEGPYDPEGGWQAVLDYSLAYHRYFKDQKWLLEKGIDEEDIGAIEDAAFKMIRLRLLKGLPKIHAVMRQLPKLTGVRDSRKELLKISDEVDSNLPVKELVA